LRKIATAEVGITASFESLPELYKDDTNLPGAINRKEEDSSRSATLFNVVIDLNQKRGVLSMGRPTEVEETVISKF
jgi:isopenicillin-N N-acyltransferase-like protein